MENTSISVCMATFNGEKFVAEQVDSIVQQLDAEDELIIVDDCSTDGTIEVLQSFNDSKIKIFRNDKNFGVNITFGRAISLATKDIIFLADQDDIWVAGRVNAMVKALQNTGNLVVSANSEYIDSAGNMISFPVVPLRAVDSANYLKNILYIFFGTASYFGCTMAFKRDIVGLILPIPSYVESHDIWIATVSNLICSNTHIENITLMRRIHGKNASIIKRSLSRKIWSRIIFLVSIVDICIRYHRYKRKYAICSL